MNGGEIHIPPESGECIPLAFERYVQSKSKSWPERIHLVLNTFNEWADFKYWDIDIYRNLELLLGAPTPKQTFCSVIEHIYRSHASKKNPSAIRWGDKTPILSQSLDRLHACYPRAYYINLVRDPREVVASMMRATNVSPSIALNRWKVSYKCADKWSRNGRLNMLTLKYEEMVQRPEIMLRAVCDFTDLNYNPSMLGEHLKIDFGDTVLPHLRSTDEALRPGGMPSQGNMLSQQQLQLIEDATVKERYALGYS